MIDDKDKLTLYVFGKKRLGQPVTGKALSAAERVRKHPAGLTRLDCRLLLERLTEASSADDVHSSSIDPKSLTLDDLFALAEAAASDHFSGSRYFPLLVGEIHRRFSVASAGRYFGKEWEC